MCKTAHTVFPSVVFCITGKYFLIISSLLISDFMCYADHIFTYIYKKSFAVEPFLIKQHHLHSQGMPGDLSAVVKFKFSSLHVIYHITDNHSENVITE